MIAISYDGVVLCDTLKTCVFFSHKEFVDMLLEYFLLMKNVVNEELKSVVEGLISGLGQLASYMG